jgi:acyl-CoA thioester hydrolase
MPKRFSTSIELRFSDLDLYGHVNNVAYFTFLETARVKLFSKIFQELTAEGILLVVGRAECDYKSPILLQDKVTVSIWVSRIGNASFDLDYQVHDGAERTYAVAKTTLVCFDKVKKAPIAVPERLKEMV